jgi:hypothetical protein
MPYVRVDPDLYLEHRGVEVFPLYEVDGAPCSYWFTTNPDNADDFLGHGKEGQFDVRKFTRLWPDCPTVAQWNDWWKPRFRLEEEAIQALIEQEIEAGRLVSEQASA